MKTQPTPDPGISLLFFNRVKALWLWLTQPVPAIEHNDVRRQAQLLASVLVALIFLSVTVSPITGPIYFPGETFWSNPTTWLSYGTAACLGAAYFLSRTRYYRPAAILSLLIIASAIFVTLVFLRESAEIVSAILFYSLWVTLISSFFLSLSSTIFLTFFNNFGIVSLALFTPYLALQVIIVPLAFVDITAVMILIFNRYRDVLEADRQAVLRAANEELLEYRMHLEDLVEVRTQELQSVVKQLQQEVVERTRVEQQLQMYSEQLEVMVEERTQELKQAQEKALRQERLAILGQMSGGVGHELRNPLSVISNAVYFLKMVFPEENGVANEYVDLIEVSVNEADKIVRDLLNLSRGRPIERQKVPVYQLMETVLKRYPPPEHVSVVTDFSEILPPIWVDTQQITQVLNNLVTNAYEAMLTQGELRLKAQLHEGMVQLTLADTGMGMSAEVLQNIFEPLFTTKAHGIGLGLVVCKNLVEINGGRIVVASKEGEGTVFTLSLPLFSASM